MTRRLLIAVSPGEIWAAIAEEAELRELRVWRPYGMAQVGDLFLGRVLELRPELAAAFVDIGLDRPGFLSGEDMLPDAHLHAGEAILVQVTKAARADKGAGLTMKPRLASRGLEYRPWQRREASEPDLSAEAAALRGRWQEILAASQRVEAPARLEKRAGVLSPVFETFDELHPDEIIIDDRAGLAEIRAWLGRRTPPSPVETAFHADRMPIFEAYGIEPRIEAALAPRVALPGGGALHIELTSVGTMIDVDSGRDEALAANLTAAKIIARQIKLRDLAGPIVIDFIGMRNRDQRTKVEAALTEALADISDIRVLGWTRLGHFELVRQRKRAPLSELLYERAANGGLVKTALTVALEALRAIERQSLLDPTRKPRLRAHPEILATLTGEAAQARSELEARLGTPIAMMAESDLARDRFDLD